MRRMPAAILVASLAAELAFGRDSTRVVEARMVTATDGVHPGTSVKAAVVADIAPGYHINDHKPTLDYLIPTEMKLEPSDQLAVEKVIYPKGELKKFEFADQPFSVYEGLLVVGAIVRAGRNALPGEYSIKGKLHYQACNDHACLPPTSVPVSLSVKVVPRSVPVKRANEDVFAKFRFD